MSKLCPTDASIEPRTSQAGDAYRILHVIDSLDLGGAQEALENLVRHSRRELFQHEVASMHRPGVYSERIARLGVPVHSLSPSKWLPVYLPNLAGLLRRGKFDAVHCHLTWANILAKPLAALCGVSVRFNHDQTNERFRLRPGLRAMLDRHANRFSTHIFAVSESIRHTLVTRGGVDSGRVSVVYNGVDLARFPFVSVRDHTLRRSWGFGPEHLVVGGIGRLHPQKNFSLFLKIADATRASCPDLRFVIVGDGPLRLALERDAGRLGLETRVRFLGFVADTSTVYNALDLLMMTSDYEGLPLTLLEAMASGVPALCSAVDGTREILADDMTGWLVPPGESAGFVTRLQFLARDRGALPTIAGNARARVEQDFSATRMTRRIEDIYRRYLDPSTAQSGG